MMNRKGFTLIEVIGGVVILGIVISLLATIFGFFISSQRRISISSKANAEGLLAIRVVKTNLEAFTPNAYETCVIGDCIQFTKAYEYVYNHDDEIIDLILYDDPLVFEIKIENNALYIDEEMYLFDGFTLTGESTLSFEEIDQVLYLSMTLFLTDQENNVFEFVLSDSVELTDVPS